MSTMSRTRRPGRSRFPSSALAVAFLAAFAATALLQSANGQGTLRRSIPSALSDVEFWQFFTTMSEDGGSFPSENFVSNEVDFQQIIPTLQRTTTPGGVYLGVGPEQNFTYITNLKPAMAVIFDIRRQNAMAHLMYKALFEMSATRAEFATKLFSRPVSVRLAPAASAEQLFTAVVEAAPSDSAYTANLAAILTDLTGKHHFALTDDDRESIRRVYRVFFDAGPGINYSYRSNGVGPSLGSASYATYAGLQSATSVDSVNMAFLASEENYLRIRAMHQKNLIVPVVGDFGGPKAVRAVGQYIRDHNGSVLAFYLSNVEQYLWNPGDAAIRFYQNVSTLPLDSTSTFIRSVPRGGAGGAGGAGMTAINLMNGMIGGTSFSGSGQMIITGSGMTSMSYSVRDSGGVRVVRTTTDSAGKQITRTSIDSTKGPILLGGGIPAGMLPGRITVLPAIPLTPTTPPTTSSTPASAIVHAINGGSLTSGIASMKETVTAFTAGSLVSWQSVIAMTKISGWK